MIAEGKARACFSIHPEGNIPSLWISYEETQALLLDPPLLLLFILLPGGGFSPNIIMVVVPPIRPTPPPETLLLLLKSNFPLGNLEGGKACRLDTETMRARWDMKCTGGLFLEYELSAAGGKTAAAESRSGSSSISCTKTRVLVIMEMLASSSSSLSPVQNSSCVFELRFRGDVAFHRPTCKLRVNGKDRNRRCRAATAVPSSNNSSSSSLPPPSAAVRVGELSGPPLLAALA